MSQDPASVCVSAQVYDEHCASSSFELYCVNRLFSRWCWVMVHAHWFPGAPRWGRGGGMGGHWQPSVKKNVWCGWKRLFGLKSSFAFSLKAYQMEAEIWHHHFVSHLAVTCRDTGPVTLRLASATADLNSNMPVSATLITCTWTTTSKCIPAIHPSSEKQEVRGLRIFMLVNPIIPTNQLVYNAVNQHTNSLGAYEQTEPLCSVVTPPSMLLCQRLAASHSHPLTGEEAGSKEFTKKLPVLIIGYYALVNLKLGFDSCTCTWCHTTDPLIHRSAGGDNMPRYAAMRQQRQGRRN